MLVLHKLKPQHPFAKLLLLIYQFAVVAQKNRMC